MQVIFLLESYIFIVYSDLEMEGAYMQNVVLYEKYEN